MSNRSLIRGPMDHSRGGSVVFQADVKRVFKTVVLLQVQPPSRRCVCQECEGENVFTNFMLQFESSLIHFYKVVILCLSSFEQELCTCAHVMLLISCSPVAPAEDPGSEASPGSPPTSYGNAQCSLRGSGSHPGDTGSSAFSFSK